MICYASRTGTKKNLKVLRDNGWRLMLSATGVWRTEGFPYAIDNGAWTTHQQGQPFDRLKFLQIVSAFGENADFIVIPDVVAGGRRSLDFSVEWLPTLTGKTKTPLLLPVQDGMTPKDVEPVIRGWPAIGGIFVGGSTEWKVSTIPAWGQFGYNHGFYVHVGRVNTKSRLALCQASAISSIDGSGPSRFSIAGEKMSKWWTQKSLVLFQTLKGDYKWSANVS